MRKASTESSEQDSHLTIDITTQILAIRNKGKTDMSDAQAVLRIADREKYGELAEFIKNYPEEYTEAIRDCNECTQYRSFCGMINGYLFKAKTSSEKSELALNHGHLVQFSVCDSVEGGAKSLELASYDNGWIIKPKNQEVKDAIEALNQDLTKWID